MMRLPLCRAGNCRTRMHQAYPLCRQTLDRHMSWCGEANAMPCSLQSAQVALGLMLVSVAGLLTLQAQMAVSMQREGSGTGTCLFLHWFGVHPLPLQKS